MGAGEDSTPAKTSKPNSSAQETPTTPSYPEWAAMQAYYGPGAAPPFFATTVASPSPHPYMWGGQHAIMPPYGTPVPYPALYPPGGVYAHPNMAMAPGLAHTSMELEGKAVNGKDRAPNKKAKGAQGNTGLIGGKGGESGNTASGSGNDGATQSAESGSEGSSDGSDDNQEFGGSESKKGSFDLMLADGANAHNNIGGHQAAVPGAIVPVPATNLNIGMDLWSASGAGAGAVKMRSNAPGSAAPGTMVGREGMMADHYIQDERELKRQKRKQSNRESARRSRLRKQAECEELQARVEALTNENSTLREELQRLSEDCAKLTSENNSIKEDLTRVCGPDAVSKLENSTNQLIQSYTDEGNR